MVFIISTSPSPGHMHHSVTRIGQFGVIGKGILEEVVLELDLEIEFKHKIVCCIRLGENRKAMWKEKNGKRLLNV